MQENGVVMGFGAKIKVETPKVDVPKVDDVTAAAKGAVTGAIDTAKDTVSATIDKAKDAASGVVGTVTKKIAAVREALPSLTTVAGAIADIAVSFTGAIDDLVLEPHFQLDANASFGETRFEKGPIRIRVDLTPEEGKSCTDMLQLFADSGGYDQKQRIRDFSDSNSQTVIVLFENAPMDKKYSLKVISQQGESRLLFSNVSYGDLRKTKQRFV